ncbi:MAG: phenylalanine--tRNA ligase subunit alpha [Deltaproteobacteria bacterium HGW-Deltaproteobacteria-17]|nr:MAG: phenylalanine--tRNA ligase subunit alpha [Deltaproteobacteria bacterium HGW-Deltaproteobacteria-17]
MSDSITALVEKARAEVAAAATAEVLRDAEVQYLGKKGEVTALLKSLGGMAPEERKAMGKAVNDARAVIEDLITARRGQLEREALDRELAETGFDLTLPGIPLPSQPGTWHPVSIIADRVERAFEQMGFIVLDYPEVETEHYNFDALNIPADHPARDMQDTFWLRNGCLLRTHTSPGQVRAMQEYPLPLRAIFPGRVFRYERTDASHEHTFHQVEGLMIDRELSVSNLIAIMKVLLETIFEREVTVRLRPGFFPFVEPGFELDIRCMNCGGAGCSVCKHSGWVELLPCGLVHPNVLRAGGVDPEKWVGWAFGLGLSRLAMMRYKISHITHFMGADPRFLRQFPEGGAR